jgi:hypothetical protein
MTMAMQSVIDAARAVPGRTGQPLAAAAPAAGDGEYAPV